jgi:hypothetical protein
MLTARFFALPAIALAVIVGLAQAHNRPEAAQAEPGAVYRAVSCATAATNDPTCALAGAPTLVR